MELKSFLLPAAALCCGLFLIQPARASVSPPTELMLQTTSESAANATPATAAGDGLYGNNSPACASSNDSVGDPCWNPLTIQFAATQISTNTTTPVPAVLGNITGTESPSSNLLNLTNSIGSYDGGVSNIQAAFGCDTGGNLVGSVVVSNEDGSVFTFTVSPTGQLCDFSNAVTFTFTSSGGNSGGDSGNATLYNFPITELSGSYKGTWDNSNPDAPLQQGGSGASSVDVNVVSDFSTTATLVLPSGSFGSCQATDETFTSDAAAALGQGVTPTLGGYSTGGDVISAVADPAGDVLWLVGTSTDAYGVLLPSSQLFFSAYVAVAGSGLSSCQGGVFWDAPFQKQHGNAKPVVHPRKYPHSQVPRKWLDRLDVGENSHPDKGQDRGDRR
jgi:hypothetical protein